MTTLTATFFPLVLTLGLAQNPTADSRPPHPLAPSLPQLTEKEEKTYESILERFIQFDIGKLPGPAGKKAWEDFNRLPSEAIFVLIDGFNRTANMEASCPAVIIGKKIMTILNASNDLELLTYAKELLGTGVTAKRHQGMLKDVQFSILLRKGALQRNLTAARAAGTVYGSRTMASMPLPELVKAAETAKTPVLKNLLTEIEKRQGPKALEALASAAANPDKDIQNWSAGLLAKHLGRQKDTQLKDFLKQDRREIKVAAAVEIGKRRLPLGDELIDLLGDSEPAVIQAARSALKQISQGLDYGPESDASFMEREKARKEWREWWMKRSP